MGPEETEEPVFCRAHFVEHAALMVLPALITSEQTNGKALREITALAVNYAEALADEIERRNASQADA